MIIDVSITESRVNERATSNLSNWTCSEFFCSRDFHSEGVHHVSPDTVAVETIDEDITLEIQEVDGGCGHRHLPRSIGSRPKFNDMKSIGEMIWPWLKPLPESGEIEGVCVRFWFGDHSMCEEDNRKALVNVFVRKKRIC